MGASSRTRIFTSMLRGTASLPPAVEQGLEARGALLLQIRALQELVARRIGLCVLGEIPPGGGARALAACLDGELIVEGSAREERLVDRVELGVLRDQIALDGGRIRVQRLDAACDLLLAIRAGREAGGHAPNYYLRRPSPGTESHA